MYHACIHGNVRAWLQRVGGNGLHVHLILGTKGKEIKYKQNHFWRKVCDVCWRAIELSNGSIFAYSGKICVL